MPDRFDDPPDGGTSSADSVPPTGLRTPAFLLFLFLAASTLYAQPRTWTDISGPYGYGTLYRLDDGTLFGRNGDGIVRSTDGGLHWEDFRRPGGPILEFDVRGFSMVIAVTVYIPFRPANWKQYFLSTDAGENWERINAEGIKDTVHAAVTLSDDGAVYGLYPSGSKMVVEEIIDGEWVTVGRLSTVPNWPRAAGVAYTTFAVDRLKNFYIGTRIDGIHSSRDLGLSWTRDLDYRRVAAVTVAPDGEVVVGCLPNGRSAGGVFASTNYGIDWEFLGLTDVVISSIRVDSSGGINVVTGSGMYQKTRNSETWEELGPFDFNYSALEITRANTYLATAEGYGFLSSHDQGRTWLSDGSRYQELYSLTSTGRGSILAGTIGHGLLRTTDGGFSWTNLRGLDIPEYFFTLHSRGDRVYAGTAKGLFSSDDDGESWTVRTGDLHLPEVDLPVYAFTVNSGGDIFIGTGVGVYSSTNGGENWQPAGLENSSIVELAVTGGGTLYAAAQYDGVFVSEDGGGQWRWLGLARPDIQSLAVNGAGDIYVGAAGGLFFSTNGGAGWTQKLFTSGHVYSILFNGNFDVYAGTSSGVFTSSNRGANWAIAGLDSLFVIALAYDRDHAMLAAAYRTGVYRTSQVVTGFAEPAPVAAEMWLSQNYPNPFNPSTAITYSLPAAGDVKVTVVDVLGREVAMLVAGRQEAGTHTVVWDAGASPAGVYFCRMTSGGFSRTRKMALVR